MIKKKFKEILQALKKHYKIKFHSIKRNEEQWKWQKCNQM